MEKGYIQIYTGEGKGKTTAALGLSFRAAGRGKKVLYIQFLKGMETGELVSINENPNIEHVKMAETTRFFHTLSTQEQLALKTKTQNEWIALGKKIKSDHYDILVLDEIMATILHGLVTEKEVLHLLKEKPAELEIILTGRNASQNLIEAADLVTEMRKIKHYYNQGITSRIGIEY